MNNLNDALAWGLVPLYLAAHGASVGQVGPSPRSTRRLGRRPDGHRVASDHTSGASRSSPRACSSRAGRWRCWRSAAASRGPRRAPPSARGGHRDGLPDAHRRRLRRGPARRAGPGGRRLPLLARRGLRARRADRRRRRRRAGERRAIALVAALTVASGLWVLLTPWASAAGGARSVRWPTGCGRCSAVGTRKASSSPQVARCAQRPRSMVEEVVRVANTLVIRA